MSDGYLLLVEDEPAVQMNNRRILQRRGHVVKQAYTLSEARALIAEEPPKGIILDVQLPDGNGLSFLDELRKTSTIPVLVLTTLDTTEDIMRGFEMGGDDYLTKPYDLPIFLMRVETLMRRASAIPDALEFGTIKIYPSSSKVVVDGTVVDVSQKEYSLLQLFVQRPNKILSPEFIYERVWGYEMIENDNAVKVTVSKLRNKLLEFGYTITASRGEGYYLEKDDAYF